MKKAVLALILAAFLPVSVEAMPVINVHLVAVSGPQSIAHKAREVFGVSRKILRESGARIRIKRFTQVEDSAPDLSSLENRRSRFDYWKDISRQRRWFKGVDLVHVMLPPIMDAGQIFIGGLADDECSRFSVSFLTEFNHLGEPRYPHSQCAMAHEIGHSLGASHGTGLMDPDAARLVGDAAECPLKLDKQAKKEIQRCQRRGV